MTASPNTVRKATTPQQQLAKGFVFAALGLLLFACMDSATKYLTEHYNVPFVVAIRYLVHFALMVLVLAPRYSAPLLHTRRRGLVAVRSIALVVASLSVGIALHRMPQADTTAITFLAPILVVLLACPLLGERIGALGWVAAVMGFMGVLLIARPGSGLDMIGVLFALLAACANTAYQLLSRMLATTERPIALLFNTALVGSLVFGLALPWTWDNQTPTYLELALFIGMGAAGGLGHYFFTLAYRYAPASFLAPVVYLQLVWAGILGWVVFGNSPDHLSLLGMLIVAASGLMIAVKSRFTKKSTT
ncbi:MAG: DMT family transporter [Cellvibrionaceae bacterium]|nr:DMT family transporter [Cellvibrionaceae bacterium]